MVPITKLTNFLRRARRAPWILGQRLVQAPSSYDSAVSDLFIWISDDDWKTFFELIGINGLFEDKPSNVVLYLFDKNGNTLGRHCFEIDIHIKNTINISKLLPSNSGDFGTFSIFHMSSPSSIIQNESFIAERGYTGYQYKSSTLLGFVHGNHDAIAFNRKTEKTELLGSSSFFNRDFNLQYLLEPEHKYFIGIVNNSNVEKNIKLSVVKNKNFPGTLYYNEFSIKPKGIHFALVELKSAERGRVVINSKLIMARPIIIRIKGINMDVFHG